MNRIQELIDERRADMPTGLAKQLLELCQKESMQDRLFHVTTVRIVATPYLDSDTDTCCQLKPIQQQHLLRSRSRSLHPTFVTEQEWLDMGYIEESWANSALPLVLPPWNGCITIVHEIKRRVSKRPHCVLEPSSVE